MASFSGKSVSMYRHPLSVLSVPSSLHQRHSEKLKNKANLNVIETDIYSVVTAKLGFWKFRNRQIRVGMQIPSRGRKAAW